MGDLSRSFSRHEFACPCCGMGMTGDLIDPRLVADLQALRDAIGKPVHILPGGGVRCRKQNAAQGGAPSSQHMLGTAADIEVEGLTADELAALVMLHCPHAVAGGIGVYRHRKAPKRAFVHLDTRRRTARWDDGPTPA